MTTAWLTDLRTLAHGVLQTAQVAPTAQCFKTKGTPFNEHNVPGLAVATPRRSAVESGGGEFTTTVDLEIVLAAPGADEDAAAAALALMERAALAALFGSADFMNGVEKILGFDSTFGLDADVSPVIGEQVLTLHLRVTESPWELVTPPDDALLSVAVDIDQIDPVDPVGGPIGGDGQIEAATVVILDGPEPDADPDPEP